MKTTIITVLLSSIIFMGLSTVVLADTDKATKPPTCKQQAKNKGIKDAAEVKAFVKECKAAAKKAKSEKK